MPETTSIKDRTHPPSPADVEAVADESAGDAETDVAAEAAAARAEQAEREAEENQARIDAAKVAQVEVDRQAAKADAEQAEANAAADRAVARAAEVRAEAKAAADAAASRPQPGTDPGDDTLEVWRNVTRGRVIVSRIGPYGVQFKETIQAGRTFALKPEERRLNQHESVNAELDAFANGILQPIRLVDGEVDTHAMLDNPNNFTDEEARQYFVQRGEFFLNIVQKITNATAVQRLRDMAMDPSVDGTMSQLTMIDARLAELATNRQIRSTQDPALGGDLTVTGGPEVPTGLNPVSPR